jgi:coenzyme Q-binding protein COQ10
MQRYEEQKTLAYAADEFFSVVADVKDYSSFVPCAPARGSIARVTKELVAELEIGFGPFRESFTSQVRLDRPRQVRVRAIEGGPLEHPTNEWTFTPAGDGTHVQLEAAAPMMYAHTMVRA